MWLLFCVMWLDSVWVCAVWLDNLWSCDCYFMWCDWTVFGCVQCDWTICCHVTAILCDVIGQCLVTCSVIGQSMVMWPLLCDVIGQCLVTCSVIGQSVVMWLLFCVMWLDGVWECAVWLDYLWSCDCYFMWCDWTMFGHVQCDWSVCGHVTAILCDVIGQCLGVCSVIGQSVVMWLLFCVMWLDSVWSRDHCYIAYTRGDHRRNRSERSSWRSLRVYVLLHVMWLDSLWSCDCCCVLWLDSVWSRDRALWSPNLLMISVVSLHWWWWWNWWSLSPRSYSRRLQQRVASYSRSNCSCSHWAHITVIVTLMIFTLSVFYLTTSRFVRLFLFLLMGCLIKAIIHHASFPVASP